MANLTFIGDIAFNGLISEQPEQNAVRFSLVAPILQEADLVFANLETPVKAGDEYNNEKSIIHYASYEVTKDLLNKLNIGCVSLANNHIYDCKMDGLKATINLLDNLGIYHTGAGWKQEHIEPVIIEKGGQQIGFLGWVV
ncbi:Bacterial capsule synthesis protein PGA_cap [anaerobic digester metagenome]